MSVITVKNWEIMPSLSGSSPYCGFEYGRITTATGGEARLSITQHCYNDVDLGINIFLPEGNYDSGRDFYGRVLVVSLAKPGMFESPVFLRSHREAILYSASIESEVERVKEMEFPLLIDSSEDKTSTISTWTLHVADSLYAESVRQVARELSILLNQFSNGEIGVFDDSLIEMAKKSIERLDNREQEEIDEWASRLAEDIADAKD